MAESNTDFLRFSAYSIKDLITRKLSEDTKFTDQIYEGSNLAILIDIVSYMYQVLIQNLNTAAAESMFSDTQLYKNIVRLVKFIGYNPKGFNPSAITAYLTVPESVRGKILPAYSYIDTGLTDSDGNQIYFSTQRNADDDSTYETLKQNTTQAYTLYNGKWKLYSSVFTASGIEGETFSLDGLKSDSSDNKYVAHNFIDIYIRHYVDASAVSNTQKYYVDENGNYYEWQRDWYLDLNGIFCGYQTDNSSSYMFNNRSAFKSIYPGDEHVYTVTLNENKTYELKFGNGVVGKKLDAGDIVYVFYLDSNGTAGQIDVHDIADASQLKFKHQASDFGLSQKLYEELFQLDIGKTSIIDEWPDGAQISFKTNVSTTPATEETVEEIRQNAPMAFMTGNRLVTRTDYEYYLKNSHMKNIVGEDVVDVRCMNNWEYMASFYKWLYDLGSNGMLVEYADVLKNGVVADSTRYLQKNNFLRYEYFYADAADANNIYIWLKTPDGNFDVSTTTSNMNKQLNPIKIMTAEILVCKAIDVNFSICAAPYEYALKHYFTDSFGTDTSFDESCESYIEITLDDNAICVPSSLQNEIASIILEAFDVNKCQFGQLVKFDNILNDIYALTNVTRVRTIFKYYDEYNNEHSRVYDGLSFASWSDTDGLIQYGDDLNISNTMRQLEDFQFPKFRESDKTLLYDRIKIIKKSLSNINTIKF